MIFRQRREDLWLGKIAMVIVAAFFVLGSFLAWFSWTQIARPKVFHVLIYNPPLMAMVIAAAVNTFSIFCALGPFRHSLERSDVLVKRTRPG